MSEDKNVFLILHCDDVLNDKTLVGFKVSTVGKLLEEQYNPVEVVPMVLFACPKYNEKGEAQASPYRGAYERTRIEAENCQNLQSRPQHS